MVDANTPRFSRAANPICQSQEVSACQCCTVPTRAVGWSPNCNEQKGAGVRIYTGGGESVCIVDLSLDDPVESDAATGSVPRELLVLLLPGLLALGLL